MRQFVRRFAVGAFGLAALVLATVGVAPQSVGAYDAFTQVGCQINDYNCLFARNNFNPNYVAPDNSVYRANFYYGYNPYFYGVGYAPVQYGYGYGYAPYSYGYGYNPYYYGVGGNYYGNGYYTYNNGQYIYTPPITRSTAPNDGFCNLGYGERGCVSAPR